MGLFSRIGFCLFCLPLVFLTLGRPAFAVEAEENEDQVEEVVVFTPRLSPSPSAGSYGERILTPEDLADAPGQRLDDILRQVPGFSLFRRSSSLSAHPTTQGPALRAISPNGAARALVLKDGIPLNDPFGGWVYWAVLDPGGIAEVRLLPGGSAGAFGSTALSGTIEIISKASENLSETEISGGRFSTFEARQRLTFEKDRTLVSLSAGYFDSGGFFILPDTQRGPVDIPAASSFHQFSGRIATPLSGDVISEVHFSYFGEERTNGLALSTNQTEALDAGIRLIKNTPSDSLDWEFNLYGRDRDFENTFASVSTDRTTSRMVLDQFDVPAREIGANGRVRVRLENLTLEAGTDLRLLKGFTNERFRNLGAGFTRLRMAGGKQLLFGGYLEATVPLNEESLTLTGRLRIDYWQVTGGLVREESLETPGEIIRNDVIGDRSGVAPTGRLGFNYHPIEVIEVKASFYSGFRVPTLNEFFRPFRVRNDITEANPLLRPERLLGTDGEVVFTPNEILKIRLGVFHNWLKGGVGNVTIGTGPGVFPPSGFVPAGGTLRQRQNIGLITVTGLEAGVVWQPAPNLEVHAAYLYQNSIIRDFPEMPSLIGNRVILSPKHSGTFSVSYRWKEKFFLSGSLRFEGKQFDDDQNTRVIGAILVADFQFSYALNDRVRLTSSLLNIFNKTIVSAIAGNGLTTLGTPRIWSAGFTATF